MPVAQGGMASVWAARLKGTRGFQRVVAIKTILPSLSDDARFEQMFLDEAALAARIRHPNVVQVLDLGEESGLLYQVMEWIDGEPLSAFLRELPEGSGLPFPIAARILIGASEGLHAAHETCDDAGYSVELVHRDISPQNILVTRDGVPKVVDFGVAKASTLSSAATGTGTLKGKPAYMAPEQIQGAEIDRRADIFSLGVMLYVLTTSRHPFRGKNDMATLHSIVSTEEAPAPSTFVDGYPEALEQVVMMAIAKDRERRFKTASALARALEAAVPDVHKVGDAEVAAFTRTLLAERLEARAAALRSSLSDADLRAADSTSPPSHERMKNPSTLQGLGGPVPPPYEPSSSSSESVTRHEGRSPGTTSTVPPAKSRSTLAVTLVALGVAGLVFLAVAVAAILFWVRPEYLAKPTIPSTPSVDPSSVASPLSPSPSGTGSSPAEADSNSNISVDSLPAATDLAPPSHPRPKGTSEPKVDATHPTPTDTPQPTTVTTTPSVTPSTPTATPGTPTPGTVPKIRDPGF
ncbi:MAG TPA: serine/threonine-protein kinase [Polyangiaceae bacterium]|nr:serine/threonine-protein kinase [Polyangiaceae bacterium]HPB94345.1 serine/threonine-protein kinase [Polyangiaceae bacterium]HPK93765.1 serine/threonine-protein kinase [Polyangiaceae bacterium]